MNNSNVFKITKGVLTKYKGKAGNVVIPDGVTSIGASAFHMCTGLISITIPDTVTSIEDSAFFNCSGLISITIPDSVTSIGDYAFGGCTGLKSITIPDSVTSISESAFSGCNSMVDAAGFVIVGDVLYGYLGKENHVVIPDSVTSIGAGAFKGCTGLKSITIPDSVTSISESAFSGCNSMVDAAGFVIVGDVLYGYLGKENHVVIPGSVTSIGAGAFKGCTGLTSITIPDTVTSIGESAFKDCFRLISITIPDRVTSIGNYAFKGCTSLTSITIPDSVTSIGASAFEGCTDLISITIPDTVTSIEYSAFYDCSGLISITIPDSVKSIGEWAFYGCTGLTSITIPDTVTSIGDNAFYDCARLSTVILGNGLNRIGEEAFCGCSRLTRIKIPKGVKTLNGDNFRGCKCAFTAPHISLSGYKSGFKHRLALGFAIAFVNGEEEYSEESKQAYQKFLKSNKAEFLPEIQLYPEVLKYYFLNDLLTSDDYRYCEEEARKKANSPLTEILRELLSPKKGAEAEEESNTKERKSVGEMTDAITPEESDSACKFEEKEDGTVRLVSYVGLDSEVRVPSQVGGAAVTEIGNSAFKNSRNLKAITIPACVKIIGEYAFWGCFGLESVYYTGGLADWCAISFEYANANPAFYARELFINGEKIDNNLVIPKGVTQIGSYAFAGCSGLQSVSIPESVACIGNRAFYQCSVLQHITVEPSNTNYHSADN